MRQTVFLCVPEDTAWTIGIFICTVLLKGSSQQSGRLTNNILFSKTYILIPTFSGTLIPFLYLARSFKLVINMLIWKKRCNAFHISTDTLQV